MAPTSISHPSAHVSSDSQLKVRAPQQEQSDPSAHKAQESVQSHSHVRSEAHNTGKSVNVKA